MRYVRARCKQHRDDIAYRIYVTDCEKYICDAIAGLVKADGIKCRYADLLEPQASVKAEKRSGEEIVQSIRDKLIGLNPRR